MDSLANITEKKHKNPAILSSLNPLINQMPENMPQDKIKQELADAADQLYSLNLDGPERKGHKSVLLLDDNEELRIDSETAFLTALNLEPGKKVKVVSIFGNTGEGKSYTLNQVFFNGEEVFYTSPSQQSCTLGVWAKYDPNLNVICLDTEGLLGISKNENRRTRMLLKVLAVSDIIIYRTKAERLHMDMYYFLGGASKIYKQHFSAALQKSLGAKTDGEKIQTGLGPSVIIFHETLHTDTLDLADVTQSPEEIIRDKFRELSHLKLNCDSFSMIKYIGVKTPVNSKTSFDNLRKEIQKQLETAEVRSARDAKYVFLMLKSLNEKFNSNIQQVNHQQYMTQFFTCPDKCQSCNAGCRLSTGHKNEGEPHRCDTPCKFEHQYQNCVYLCRQCNKNGNRVVVKPSYQTTTNNSWTSYLSYVWSGYVIECPKCGEIYRSRQHWYGNKNPEDSAIQLEIVHIWPGERMFLGTTQNSAQRVVDGVAMITDAVTSVGSKPVQMITDLVNDKLIAPSYWRPNHEIQACFKCNISFVPGGQTRIVPSKHHCRSCGEGFCGPCSSKRTPVPQKGWKDPVRVCDACYQELDGRGHSLLAGLSGEEQNEVIARYISENVANVMSAVKSGYDISKDFVKDKARPSYWTPDNECIACVLCSGKFGPLLPIHHCRDCGKGVCENCSSSKKAVPLKGWDTPVRVCDNCR